MEELPDFVEWRPFCAGLNTSCPCMEPSVAGPCEEFVEDRIQAWQKDHDTKVPESAGFGQPE